MPTVDKTNLKARLRDGRAGYTGQHVAATSPYTVPERTKEEV